MGDFFARRGEHGWHQRVRRYFFAQLPPRGLDRWRPTLFFCSALSPRTLRAGGQRDFFAQLPPGTVCKFDRLVTGAIFLLSAPCEIPGCRIDAIFLQQAGPRAVRRGLIGRFFCSVAWLCWKLDLRGRFFCSVAGQAPTTPRRATLFFCSAPSRQIVAGCDRRYFFARLPPRKLYRQAAGAIFLPRCLFAIL